MPTVIFLRASAQIWRIMTDDYDLIRDFEHSWLEALAELRQRLEQAQHEPRGDDMPRPVHDEPPARVLRL